MHRGCPKWTRAVTTLQASDGAPTAIALLDATGTIERATTLFLDRYGADDGHLSSHQSELEGVISGRLHHAKVALGDVEADVSAVVGPGGRRYALLTITVPQDDTGRDRRNPLIEEPIDDSPAIVWLKDLDGRYMRVNSRYAEQLQTDPDHVCGKTDAELSPNESIEGWRLRANDLVPEEPLELEYTVAAFDNRPAFAVLRFALRDLGGQPSAVCGVAAPLAQARVARSECERLMRIERWSRLDQRSIREELIDDWGLSPATEVADGAQRPPALDGGPAVGTEQLAAIAAERDAAVATSARLDQQLAREHQEVISLRENATVAFQRAGELLERINAAQARNAELEQSLSEAEERLAGLEGERDSERSRAEQAETSAAEALAAEGETTESLRAELSSAHEELERARAAALELPTNETLEAERSRVEEARLAAEQASAEAASTSAALESERQTVEALRAELQAAREEAQSALAEARDELRRTQADAAGSLAALSAERATVETLYGELTAVGEELERVRRALSESPRSEQLEALRSRAEQAEAANEEARAEAAAKDFALEEARGEAAATASEVEEARVDAATKASELEEERSAVAALRSEVSAARDELEGQRAHAEETAAAAERAEREATDRAAELDDLRRTIEALQSELSGSREEAERVRARSSGADSPRADFRPSWDAAAQRELSASLVGVAEWRTALKHAVRTLGSEGRWDAAVAWCPETDGRGFLKCEAMWTEDPLEMESFETLGWQHRPEWTGTEFGRARNRPAPTCLLELQSAEDGLLRVAAKEGMGSALLVPIRDGQKTIGMLGLMSRTETAPDPKLMLSLEAVASQLAAIAQLLNLGAAAHWALGRL